MAESALIATARARPTENNLADRHGPRPCPDTKTSSSVLRAAGSKGNCSQPWNRLATRWSAIQKELCLS